MKPASILKILVCTACALLSLKSFGAITGKDLWSQKTVQVEPAQKGTVVVFMSAKCPCSNSHVQIMKQLAADFKNFAFVVVHSNRDETQDLSQNYFKKLDLPFPVIQDEENRIADQFRALKTPHAFVLNPDGKILYKGGVTSSTNGEAADKQYLRDALNDISAGRDVKVAEGRTLGCIISRGEKHAW